MANGFKAIVTAESIRYPGGRYDRIKAYVNGVIVGQAGAFYVACFHQRLRGLQAMFPVVGCLNDRDHVGWVWPSTEYTPFTWDTWSSWLRQHGLLVWRELLADRLVKEPMIRLAIEDYSLDDLVILRDHAWFVGRSLHAPLWRVYALVPARLWESTTEFPTFDGQVRSLNRFGAIYDPYTHKLMWK